MSFLGLTIYFYLFPVIQVIVTVILIRAIYKDYTGEDELV